MFSRRKACQFQQKHRQQRSFAKAAVLELSFFVATLAMSALLSSFATTTGGAVVVGAKSSSSGRLLFVGAFRTTGASYGAKTAAAGAAAAAYRHGGAALRNSKACFGVLSRAAHNSRADGRRAPRQCVLATSSSSAFSPSSFSSSSPVTRLFSSTVEENLDAALEDILGDALLEAENPPDMQPGNHMKGSRPMPKNLIEEDADIDYADPTFLSTSNPRWTEPGRIHPKVIDVLSSKGITQFTPVQGEAFDPIVARRDVIGRSRTGTGKTLAFGLPSLTRIVELTERSGKRDPGTGRMRRGRFPSMLVLCPTRELARQVQQEISEVASPLGLFAEVFHGGVSYDPQARALRQGIDILVGTPGRVMDHLNRGNLDLAECDIVVLDEADEMLQMGFAEDVEVRFSCSFFTRMITK